MTVRELLEPSAAASTKKASVSWDRDPVYLTWTTLKATLGLIHINVNYNCGKKYKKHKNE